MKILVKNLIFISFYNRKKSSLFLKNTKYIRICLLPCTCYPFICMFHFRIITTCAHWAIISLYILYQCRKKERKKDKAIRMIKPIFLISSLFMLIYTCMCSMEEKEFSLFVKNYGIPSNMSFILYLLVNLLLFISFIFVLYNEW